MVGMYLVIYRTFLGTLVAVAHVSIGRTRAQTRCSPIDIACCATRSLPTGTPVSSQRPARGGWWWVRLSRHLEGVGTVRVTNPSLNHVCILLASQNTNVRITNLCSAGFKELVVTPRDMYTGTHCGVCHAAM